MGYYECLPHIPQQVLSDPALRVGRQGDLGFFHREDDGAVAPQSRDMGQQGKANAFTAPVPSLLKGTA